MRLTKWILPAVVASVLVGFGRGLSTFVGLQAAVEYFDAVFAVRSDLDSIALLGPLLVAAAGYLWAVKSDVRSTWGPLLASTLLAAAAGFLVAYLLGIRAATTGSRQVLQGLFSSVRYDVTWALSLLTVPLFALGGGAIATFSGE